MMDPEDADERTLVFVYGTLRRGAAQGGRMQGCGHLGSGFVRGCLYRVDWYPAVVLGTDGIVVGEVFEVDEERLAGLDEYEGDEYRRVRVVVEGAFPCEAWIWEWQRPVTGLELLPGGDWLREVGAS